jgi:hypothetical protein
MDEYRDERRLPADRSDLLRRRDRAMSRGPLPLTNCGRLAAAVGAVLLLACTPPQDDAADAGGDRTPAARASAAAEAAGGDVESAAREPLAPEPAAGAAPAQVSSDRSTDDRAGGKPVAAFGLDYAIEGVAEVGAPLVLRVSLRPRSRVEDVTVRVLADEALYIDAAGTVFTAAAVTADAPAEWAVEVVPTREGRFLARIHVEGSIDGVRQAGSVAAPIRVAGAGREKASETLALPDAEAHGGAQDAAAPGETAPRRIKRGAAAQADPVDKAPEQETQIRLPATERR